MKKLGLGEFFVWLLAVTMLGATQTGAAALVPVSLETVSTTRSLATFTRPSLSPDGNAALFNVCSPRISKRALSSFFLYKGCSIQTVDIRGGRTETLNKVGLDAWQPVWSPTGNRVAFLAGTDFLASRLYVRSRTGVPIDLGPVLGDRMAQWADEDTLLVGLTLPNSQHAANVDPYRTATSTPYSTGTVYRSAADLTQQERERFSKATPPGPYAVGPMTDLIAVDVKTASRRVIASNIRLDSAVVSPNRLRVAFVSWVGFVNTLNSQRLKFDIEIAPTHGLPQAQWILESGELANSAVSWSPDSRYIAWFGWRPSGETDLRVFDSNTKTTRILGWSKNCTDLRPGALQSGGPVWVDDTHIISRESCGSEGNPIKSVDHLIALNVKSGKIIDVRAMARAEIRTIVTDDLNAPARHNRDFVVLARDRDTHDDMILSISGNNGAVHRLGAGSEEISSATSSRDSRRLLLMRESVSVPPDLWSANLDEINSAVRLTNLNPRLANIMYGSAMLLSYRDAQGTQLHGALLLPPSWKPGHRVPLIVYPYGSENKSAFANSFGFLGDAFYNWFDNMQIFATRGYAVLFPDAPLHTGTPMRDIARTVLAGVDETIRIGVVDPKRVGVMGVSYGGYTVYSLITQTHRFRAAIASAGLSNWIDLYAELEDDGSAYGINQAEEQQYGLGGDPWRRRDRYIANSPFWLLDRVTTPVLIIHGTSDSAVDVFNSRMTFVALRRLGADVEFVSYRGEDHGPSGSWRYVNELDYAQRAIAWFDRFLCPNRMSPTSCATN